MGWINNENLILMHLEGFEELRDEEEVPFELTPKGIIKSVDLSEGEPFATLEGMSERGLIEKDERIISGEQRKRNVYFLTEKGKERERKAWKEIKNKEVELHLEDSERTLKVKNIENHIDGRNPVVKGIRAMDDDAVIDLTGLGKTFEVFVGRKDVFTLLKNRLKDARKEGPETLLIEGEAGIGKTSLVSRLKPFSKEMGFRFLTGTCQSETSDPYLPFKEAFDEYLEEEVKKETDYVKSVAFIGSKLEEEVKSKDLFDAKKRKTFQETTTFIKELAEDTPLVVFLDDLQWVDKATLDILAYMNDRLKEAPVFFIGAYRGEDIHDEHHLTDIMHLLNREGMMEKIDLEPLTYEDTRETVKGILGRENVPEYFVQPLHKKTDGNPLFIKESLRQMIEDGTIDPEKDEYPESEEKLSFSEVVHNVIERRVTRLDDQTIKVVELGSVIGTEVPFDILARTSEFDEIDLLDHIDMLVEKQLWTEDPTDEIFYFSHDLVQETVYNSIKSLKKKLLHKKVAESIEKVYEGELEKKYSDLAEHYRKAENNSKALKYLIEEGEKAEEVYAHNDAIGMYEKSLRMMEGVEEQDDVDITKIEILEKLADTCKTVGEYEKAREFLDEMCEKGEEQVDTLRALRKKATTWLDQGQWKEARDCIQTALEKEITDDPSQQKELSRLLGKKGWVEMRLGNHEKAMGSLVKKKELSERLGEDDLIAGSLHVLGTLYYTLGKMDKASSFLERALDIREDKGDIMKMTSSLNNLGLVKMAKSEWDEAEDIFERALQKYKKVGDTKGLSVALNNLGDIYREKGGLEKAIDHFSKSLKIENNISDDHGIAGSLTNIGITHHLKGDFDKALSCYKRSLEKYTTIGSHTRIGWVYRCMGDAYAREEEWEEAFEAYEKALERWEKSAEEEEHIITLISMMEARIRSNDLDKAEELSRKIHGKMGGSPLKSLEGDFKRVLGILHREKDELEKAEKQLRDSEKLLKGRSNPDHPKVLYEFGVLNNQMGDLAESKKYLEKARDKFQEMEMDWWENRAEEYLQEEVS